MRKQKHLKELLQALEGVYPSVRFEVRPARRVLGPPTGSQ